MDVMSPPRSGQNDRKSVDISSPIEDDFEDSLPPTYRTVPTQLINRATQPTQLLEPSSPDTHLAESPSRPVVEVAASSPLRPPPAKRTSLLASAMAPAGTVFRRPHVLNVPKPIQIDSDDDGPQYAGGDSDSDDNPTQSDIKPASFGRQTLEKIEESPRPSQGKARFEEIAASSFYRPQPNQEKAEFEEMEASSFWRSQQQPTVPQSSMSNGVKRSAGDIASAYGNVSKKARQVGPSRAMPVAIDDEPDMELDDVTDPNLRVKLRKMHELFPKETLRLCHQALLRKKGNYDDACQCIVDETSSLSSKAKSKSKSKHIDLTGSDDELLFTPRAPQPKISNVPRPTLVNNVRQQAKKPAMSIQQKYQHKTAPKHLPAAPKKLDIFDTPKPVLKKRSLVRGRKEQSSSVQQAPVPQVHHIESDDEEAAGSASEPEDLSFNGRLLHFFNNCTLDDLVDTASVTKEVGIYFLSKRPFKSLMQVEKVRLDRATSSKSRAKPQPVGEKIYDKCDVMLKAYEAVDYLVKRCENIAKPIVQSMSNWGINVFGERGDVNLASMHDSGIGTPVSDEDIPIKDIAGKSGFFGQPITMAEDVKLKDYQIVGINWLNLLYNAGHSCILADDMGLGKTCQVIAFIAHLCEIGQHGPHLIVVPAATLENWLKEFQRFAPGLAVKPYYGSIPEREQMRYEMDEDRHEINVIITTKETAKAKEDFPWLRNYGFNCAIFDEGHFLKNAESDVAKKLVRIKSNFRLLLTGTPLQNNLRELISLLAFLMPAMFNEKRDELQSIFSHTVKTLDADHGALLSAQRIARARSMLTPFILRRKKNQVLKDLPRKERHVVYAEATPEQAELYEQQLGRAYDIRARRAAGENVINESSNVLMRLRQAALHPFLFRRLYRDKLLPVIAKQCLKDPMWIESNPDLIVTELTAYSDMEIHKLCTEHKVLHKYALNNGEWLASGKVQEMLQLLRQWMQEGHRTLVFSQFTMVLDILEVVFSQESIAYFRLDGGTKVNERQDMIDEFCHKDNNTPVFMLSTKAGGAGINLAAANKVIIFDSGFNPQDDIQAENRAHRIGQVKDVEVVRLITKGTVEEQIYSMGLTKLKLDEQVAGDEDGESDRAREKMEEEGRKKVEAMFFAGLEEKKRDQMLDSKKEDHMKEEVESGLSCAVTSSTVSKDLVKEEAPKEDLAIRLSPVAKVS